MSEVKTEPRRGMRLDWSRVDSIALVAVVIAGALLRLSRLNSPDDLMFDEVYYAKDACWYVVPDPDLCDTDYEITGVHPPLGKWILALGVRVFGYDPFGWRVAAAAAGVVTIALLYVLAKKILRSTLGATIASGLLAIDLLHLVQSRIAMLDVFVPLFAVAAFLFLAFDRDRLLESGTNGRHGLRDRPWRLLAGVAAGAAVASKWSGGVVLLAVWLITVTWELTARRNDGRERVLGRFLREESASIVLWLVVVPAVLYLLTYIGRIQGAEFLAAPWSEESWFRQVWDKQVGMLDFHANLTSTHSYQSPAWSWMLLKRPVSYAFDTTDAGAYKEVFATGNPFVWWSSILAIFYVAYRWTRSRNLSAPEGLILAGFAFTYAPWLVLGGFSDRSAIFLFYLLPTIPFMCLALAYVATRIGDSWEAKATISLFSVGAVALFVFYYPLAANVAIPEPQWRDRIWIFDNCDKPPGVETTTTVTETTKRGEETVRTSLTTDNSSLPPTGWCWI